MNRPVIKPRLTLAREVGRDYQSIVAFTFSILTLLNALRHCASKPRGEGAAAAALLTPPTIRLLRARLRVGGACSVGVGERRAGRSGGGAVREGVEAAQIGSPTDGNEG